MIARYIAVSSAKSLALGLTGQDFDVCWQARTQTFEKGSANLRNFTKRVGF